MAGHSKFKNIMHRKGAQDAKRAKIFTRLGKELSVAVKSGTDPAANPRLRAAIAACKSANMPKENISKVLKKAEEGSGNNYDEIRYEGFGPNGTAYQTDIGMCGDYDSVIGMEKKGAISRFFSKKSFLKVAKGEITICGSIVEIDDKTGKALKISPLRMGGRLSSTID